MKALPVRVRIRLAANRNPHPEGEAELGRDVGRRVRPDTEERPLPEGNLPRETGEYVQPDRPDRRDQDLEGDPEERALDQERPGEEENEEGCDADLDERGLQKLHVPLVGGPEITAILHALFSRAWA
jgi:hypothetical protein